MIYHKTWNPVVPMDGGVREVVDKNFLRPLKYKKPIRVLVGKQFDIFHPKVSQLIQSRVLSIIKATPNVTYLIPTDFPERMILIEGLDNMWFGLKARSTEQLREKLVFFKECDSANKFVWLWDYKKAIDLDPLFKCTWTTHYSSGRFLPIYPCPVCSGDGVVNRYNLRWMILSGSPRHTFSAGEARSVRYVSHDLGIPFYYEQALIGNKLIHEPYIDGKQYREIPAEINKSC